MSVKQSVPVNLLAPGMVLKSDIYGGGRLLLAKNLEIQEAFIDRLKERGIHEVQVLSEDAELILHQFDITTVAKPANESKKEISEKNTRMNQIYTSTTMNPPINTKIMQAAKESVSDVFERLWIGDKKPHLSGIRENIKGIVKQVIDNPNTTPKLMAFCSYDEYTFVHSVNVGIILSVCLVGLMPQATIEEIAFAGTLHDIGKTRIPLDIINKPGKLDDEEFELMKKHPEYGIDIITEENISIHDNALKLVLDHHQKYNGTGYPGRKSGDLVNMQAHLAAVCDVYDALTTKRSYKDALPFKKAMEIIISGSGTHFHPDAINLFLKKIGLFPVGSVVEIDTGEIGVVVKFDKTSLHPAVDVIFDPKKPKIKNKTIRTIDDVLPNSVTHLLTEDEVLKVCS